MKGHAWCALVLVLLWFPGVAGAGRAVLADGTVLAWQASTRQVEVLDHRLPHNRFIVRDRASRWLYLTRTGFDYEARGVDVLDARSLRVRYSLDGVERLTIPADSSADFVLAESRARRGDDQAPYDPDFGDYDDSYRFLDRQGPQRALGPPISRGDASWEPSDCVVDGGVLLRDSGAQSVLTRAGVLEREAQGVTIGLRGCWPDGLALLQLGHLQAYAPAADQRHQVSVPVRPQESCGLVPERSATVLCLERLNAAPIFRVRVVDLSTGAIHSTELHLSAFADAHFAQEIGASEDGRLRVWKTMVVGRQDRIQATGPLIEIELAEDGVTARSLDLSRWPRAEVNWIEPDARRD